MDRSAIDIGEHAFTAVNYPLIIFSVVANLFYAWCLTFPLGGRQRLKQPLKTLLGFLVWCSIMYCASLIVVTYVLKRFYSDEIYSVVWIIVVYFTHNSMTCYVWLNLYYYIQIVPAQRALLTWVKKNITSVIYVALFFDRTVCLVTTTIDLAHLQCCGQTYINGTRSVCCSNGLRYVDSLCFYIIKVYICVCLFVMLASNLSTAHYLHRHMRRMAKFGDSFSAPKIQGQMRVTITGLLQGLLYFLYNIFYLADSCAYILSPDFYLGPWVSFTATTVYISASTVSLGVGQATFRRGAADAWKALKGLCGVCEKTNDGESALSQFTSGEATY